MMNILLKPLQDDDVAIMERWLQEEHVAPWYEEPEAWLREIAARHTDYHFIQHFIALCDDEPIGFCQYYDCFFAGEDWYRVTKQGSMYSIDYLVGEKANLGKGFGKAILKALERIICEQTSAKCIVVQPEAENIASNKLLQSCGYCFDAKNQYYIKQVSH